MRNGISIANLESAQTGGGREKMCPAYLKEIEMVLLRFPREASW
jgi:hypothetical protein